MHRTRLHVALSFLALGLALGGGWLATRFSTSIDLTANARHGLTPGTLAVLDALEVPVSIVAVLGPDPEVRAAVVSLVDRYRERRPDLSLEFLDPEADPARARELDAAPGGELILTGGGRTVRLARLDERALTGALRQVGREGVRRLAFVAGHGERAPAGGGNDDWGLAAGRLAAIGLETRELSFVTEPRVPPEVDVLVVAAPVRPWFPGEVAGVVEHVRAGGNLLWLIDDPVDAPPGGPAEAVAAGTDGDAPGPDAPAADGSPALAAARPEGPGLGALAVELGVDALPGRVIDAASQGVAGDAPDFVVLSALPRHPATAALAGPVLLPQATALAVTPLAGQETLALLATPEASWTETGALEGAVGFDAGTDEVAGPLVLGATIERPRGPGAPPQRIAVIGDADFGASRYLGNGANAALVESLALWLAGDDAAMAFATAPAPDAELVIGTRGIVALGGTWLVGVPLALLAAALAVALRRRRA